MLRYITFLTVFIFIAFVTADCQQKTEREMPLTGSDTTHKQSPAPEILKAVAVLQGTEGNEVSGTVTFIKEGNTMRVVADVIGLKPGKHGFHIHEYGDCTSHDAMTAGGHFNPDNVRHGAPTDSMHHAGDLGNLEAKADGKAHLEMTDSLLSFEGSHNIIGRGVIVHGGVDDLTSQPAGNAGPRVACGVIGIAKP
ncbi:MAG TPA: superoxide dismutase family protein [Ignavibacteriaceae bacterium]|nr:superoxide dismutase family protein [Ignavibacteriaceae bacterium]